METYTKGEVITMFRQAADRAKQIQILAECQCCSRDAILDILAEAGEDVAQYRSPGRRVEVVAGTHGKHWTAQEDELLRARFEAGVSNADIAVELGVHDSLIYTRAKKLGLIRAAAAEPERKKYGRLNEADIEAIVDLRQDGVSNREIAKRIGTSRQSVDRYVRMLKDSGRLPEGYKSRSKKAKEKDIVENAGKAVKPDASAELLRIIDSLDDASAVKLYEDVRGILCGITEAGYYTECDLPARIADCGAALNALTERVDAIKREVVGDEIEPEKEEVFSFPAEGAAPCDPDRWGFERRWNLAFMLADMMGGDPREVRVKRDEMCVEFGDVRFDVRFAEVRSEK